ncbi:MAG TPA: heparinase II/III-family protein [Candidatus Gemmiger excrementavium]|uniref:Heparinase II/III-family protein n=1 Tax=Candidatus Gemmiger excrementavium TaxID=2838608 RepID=A0A9D2F2Y7_9FIRM|nr:heparinase II/III-family protein [Candidatus Gemmiger excrementavium]
MDGGRGTYVEGPLRRALKSPAAHNTLRLDDTDFTRYLSTWGWDSPAEPLPAVFRTTPAADYLRAGHLGYLDRGCVVERTVVFIKSGWVVVADMLRTADDRPHTARQYFHFGPGALTREEDAVHWQGQKTDARLFWLSGQTPTLGRGTLAPRYNTHESAPTLTLDTDFTGTTVLLTVVALQDRPARVELLPVTDAAGHILPATAAQALRLTSGPDHSTLLLAHQAPGAGLLCAGGHAGYGRALLFTHDTPGGLCLA